MVLDIDVRIKYEVLFNILVGKTRITDGIIVGWRYR